MASLLIFVVYNFATQSEANSPAASPSPGSLLEMQNSWSHSIPNMNWNLHFNVTPD